MEKSNFFLYTEDSILYYMGIFGREKGPLSEPSEPRESEPKKYENHTTERSGGHSHEQHTAEPVLEKDRAHFDAEEQHLRNLIDTLQDRTEKLQDVELEKRVESVPVRRTFVQTIETVKKKIAEWFAARKERVLDKKIKTVLKFYSFAKDGIRLDAKELVELVRGLSETQVERHPDLIESARKQFVDSLERLTKYRFYSPSNDYDFQSIQHVTDLFYSQPVIFESFFQDEHVQTLQDKIFTSALYTGQLLASDIGKRIRMRPERMKELAAQALCDTVKNLSVRDADLVYDVKILIKDFHVDQETVDAVAFQYVLDNLTSDYPYKSAEDVQEFFGLSEESFQTLMQHHKETLKPLCYKAAANALIHSGNPIHSVGKILTAFKIPEVDINGFREFLSACPEKVEETVLTRLTRADFSEKMESFFTTLIPVHELIREEKGQAAVRKGLHHLISEHPSFLHTLRAYMERFGLNPETLRSDPETFQSVRHGVAKELVAETFVWPSREFFDFFGISEEQLRIYIEISRKITDSPSQEVQKLRDALIVQLLDSERPVEDYEKIESIFLKNNIPTVGKCYGVFEVLYPPKRLIEKIGTHSSPVLQQAGSRKRYAILYQDLLRIHIESGNRSLKEYAEVLQEGSDLLVKYERDGLTGLDTKERERLCVFVGKLETLLAKSALDTAPEAFQVARLADLEKRIVHVRKGLKVRVEQSVLERISEMFLRPAGVSSMEELLERMRSTRQAADERNRRSVANKREKRNTEEPIFDLQVGDFLKGVDIQYISNILQNGSVAKEFLGASSDSDSTPLDTDVSMVSAEDAQGGFEHAVYKSLAKDYGDLLFCLRDRGQYQHTESSTPVERDRDKWELFKTGVVSEYHYGIRTGFPSTEIDFMIVKTGLSVDTKALERLFFEIAKNGFYIPVVDFSGKIILSPEAYDGYRACFAGLESFDGPPLAFQPVVSGDRSYEKIMKLMVSVAEDRERVQETTVGIHRELEQILAGLGVKLRSEFDTSILGAELSDIGSTGRHTNMPGDFDFDFSLKLDAKDFSRAQELAETIKGAMLMKTDDSHREEEGYYQLRVKGVTRLGSLHLKQPLDIDIGFSRKADMNVYGSHDALRDKLHMIEKTYGEQARDQVLANIVFTKQILKQGNAYKKQEHGGMGGVGVEHWILANGGNMETAFRRFLEAAYEEKKRIPYEKFREKYHVMDAGINVKFMVHDDFIRVLKPSGYAAMLDVIEKYFK
ncbi:MAG: hypothetical protein UU48_C0006G0064 [Candidatus Uhrbacteria bacterium GW2011_GWF2_41_16]|uniref:Uncharacterized protein n=1 Tax=Candidatus Uhrbacteria bacterium GW2011_GWF2_41_16 TaxID=1618997 RepID=A0A0G0VAU0_9BACT|nr:MAG: hypothetical protein UU48_C0006G0064 [Candidatus Uhrbacteria bacterium GW2011_GWF2_41_16]